jgi:TPR repeat protein
VKACKLVGDMYINSDAQRSISYYNKACGGNNLDIYYFLGLAYKNENAVKWDLQKSENTYSKSIRV